LTVVDASALLEVVLRSSRAGAVEARILAPNVTLHAPHLIDAEVAQVLRRYALAGELEPGRGREALADLSDLPPSRYPLSFFLPRIWELPNNLTAYDAAYVALAEALGAPLLTCDERLARSAGHRTEIVAV
jgi:predicted nucleic acid-binding protein